MASSGWTFTLFETADKKKPAMDFLQSLPKSEQGAFTARIQMIQAQGLNIPRDILEPLGGNLYSLRVPNTPNNPRLFLCAIEPKTFVALHGYCKRERFLDDAELKIAKSRAAEVFANKKRYAP